MPHPLPKTPFVYGSDLFKQYDRIPGQTTVSGRQRDMGRKFCLALPTGDRCSDYSGAETIPNIVLHDKHRSNASLFRPNYGTQVRIINLSSFYCHAPSRSDIWCSAAASADRNSFPKRTGFNQSHIGRPDATGRIVLENAPLWCTIILWDWCEDGQKKQEEDLLFFCQTTHKTSFVHKKMSSTLEK